MQKEKENSNHQLQGKDRYDLINIHTNDVYDMSDMSDTLNILLLETCFKSLKNPAVD